MPKIRRLLTLALAVALLAAGALLGRPHHDQHPPAVRRATVDVPSWSAVPQLRFVSRRTGYAVLHGCAADEPDCPVSLFGTVDGGVTWRPIAHPASGRIALYASPRALVLWWRARDVWLMSVDAGATWMEVERGLAPYRVVRGFFQVDGGGLIAWRDGLPVRAPGRLPLPFVSAVATGADGRVWVACLTSGGVRAAVSVDGGETWAEMPVVAQGGWPVALSIEVSADGRDAWLLGHPSDMHAFPLLWTVAADRWLPVAAAGHPSVLDSAIAVGGAGLVVSGRAGTGLISRGRYWPLPGWPSHEARFALLEDGTVFAQEGPVGWLGTGVGAHRSWTRIVLEPT